MPLRHSWSVPRIHTSIMLIQHEQYINVTWCCYVWTHSPTYAGLLLLLKQTSEVVSTMYGGAYIHIDLGSRHRGMFETKLSNNPKHIQTLNAFLCIDGIMGLQ